MGASPPSNVHDSTKIRGNCGFRQSYCKSIHYEIRRIAVFFLFSLKSRQKKVGRKSGLSNNSNWFIWVLAPVGYMLFSFYNWHCLTRQDKDSWYNSKEFWSEIPD